jgi:hypothetical protein
MQIWIPIMKYMKQFSALILMFLGSNMTMASELEEAIVYGNLLTEAVNGKAEVELKKLSEFKSIKQFLSENKCPGFKYKGYIVGPENNRYFYLVASKGKGVIIGRHFKAPFKAGSIEAAKFESSTNGCLNLGVPPSNVAAMYATHLKPYPNEFHLLQSNLNSITLFIGTKAGMYAVENGAIKLSEGE